MAAWLDDDRAALRVLRLLAAVPLPGGVVAAERDSRGRPRLPLLLKPGQYPGPTLGGLPEVPLSLLYWQPAAGRWQISGLQRATLNEQWPLQPLEQAVADRLDRLPSARDAVYLLVQRHYFHPPALDDARELPELLETAARWQAELLSGRVVAGAVPAAMPR